MDSVDIAFVRHYFSEIYRHIGDLRRHLDASDFEKSHNCIRALSDWLDLSIAEFEQFLVKPF